MSEKLLFICQNCGPGAEVTTSDLKCSKCGGDVVIKKHLQKTTIVNLRQESYDVYIGRVGRGRAGYFGNPFPVATYGREGCLEAYRKYFEDRIRTDAEFRGRVLQLEGLRLGCYCKPLPCHGDIIAEFLEKKETPC